MWLFNIALNNYILDEKKYWLMILLKNFTSKNYQKFQFCHSEFKSFLLKFRIFFNYGFFPDFDFWLHAKKRVWNSYTQFLRSFALNMLIWQLILCLCMFSCLLEKNYEIGDFWSQKKKLYIFSNNIISSKNKRCKNDNF